MSGMKTVPKCVPVHEMKRDASLLSVLPASHAVTSCDIVSLFAGHGKVTAWKAFENNSQSLTGLGYGQLTNESVDNVEKCVFKILDPSTGSQILTKCECYCLIREKTQVGFLLHLHIRRALYQTTTLYMVECYSSVPRAHWSPNLQIGARPLQQPIETKAVAVRNYT